MRPIPHQTDLEIEEAGDTDGLGEGRSYATRRSDREDDELWLEVQEF